jgi:hypothetical protein
MVMLTRGWQRIVALVTALTALGRFASGAVATHAPHDEEGAEKELTSAVVSKAAAEQAPPALMPNRRYIHAEPQNFSRYTPQDDSWWMGMPLVLRDLATKQNSSV